MTLAVSWSAAEPSHPRAGRADDVSGQDERAERWRGWMTAAQDGDSEAYRRLLTELLPFLRGVTRGRLGDDPGVDDVVQEVLVRIHTARHTYRPERALLPWVRTIARNAAIDWARRQARLRARQRDVDADTLPAEPAAAPLGLSRGMLRALDQLPDGQRQAVMLLKVEGLSVQEAARKAGTTPGALKLRAHRGYRALRDHLKGDRG